MNLSSLVIPVLLAGVAVYGMGRRVDVYGALTHGAEEGLTVLLKVLPALVGLLTAVAMFRASGALEWFTGLCAPVLEFLGIPPEATPLMLVRPVSGSGALAVGVVTFGNRSYDNSLAELCAALEAGGFHTVAGGAFACRHAFTDALADGRPDWDDKRQMESFAARIADKVAGLTDIPAPVAVPGDAAAPYYVPKGTDGQPAKFLKAKPQTDLSRCTDCGACARLCPMGAINPSNVAEVPGTCIKCQCCVRKCTKHAKYFDDPNYLYHKSELEDLYSWPRKTPELFL